MGVIVGGLFMCEETMKVIGLGVRLRRLCSDWLVWCSARSSVADLRF